MRQPAIVLLAAAVVSLGSCRQSVDEATRSDCSCSVVCAGSQSQSRLSVCGAPANAVSDAKASCEVNAPCTGAMCTCTCAQLPTANLDACTATDKCATSNGGCSTNATCSAFTGGVNCTCGNGFATNMGACTDVDECSGGTASCSPDATCTNTPGSFTCTCRAGFTGDGRTCTDVDECSTGASTCSANATCVNTPGSFTCACKAGFTGDGGACADVDECTAGSAGCSPLARCTNTLGSFSCDCPPGLLGDGGTCLSRLPPTGVTSCYGGCVGTPGTPACAMTPLCGQDFQYPQRTRTFSTSTVGADTLVTDSRTGLTWMKTPLAPMTAQAGITTCSGLTLGGETGWRLPRQFELYGLFKLASTPFIDSSFDLPAGMPERYYSSTSNSQVGCGASNTFFAAAGFNAFDTGGACSPQWSYRIRCVRGPEWDADAAGRFSTVMASGVPTFVDNLTGLQWQGGASFAAVANMTTWANMLAYCEGSTYGGFTDWRLPDFMEAQTLVMKHAVFGETAASAYVTSTYLGVGVTAVRLGDGLTYGTLSPTAALASSSFDDYRARCVRGGR